MNRATSTNLVNLVDAVVRHPRLTLTRVGHWSQPHSANDFAQVYFDCTLGQLTFPYVVIVRKDMSLYDYDEHGATRLQYDGFANTDELMAIFGG